MEVSPINQNPIVNVELSCFFYMQGASFIVDGLEDVVDVVVHCRYSVEPSFCGRRGEFIVIIEVHSAWIKGTETSISGEFVGSGGSSIIGKFCKR